MSEVERFNTVYTQAIRSLPNNHVAAALDDVNSELGYSLSDGELHGLADQLEDAMNEGDAVDQGNTWNPATAH